MIVSEEEFRVVLIGLVVGGVLAFALVAACVAIYDRVKANQATERLRREFPR